MKKVVILMSTYNGEKYIREQIDSILNQKGEFILDLVVRDDGSSDKTCSILDEYQNSKKLRWYKGNNLKPARSFMDLIYKVNEKYDYYAFSDQDDVWNNDKIENAIKLIDDKCPCVYYSNLEIVDSNLNPLGQNVYKNIPMNNFESVICCFNGIGCTMVFNKKVFEIIRKNEMPKIINMHDNYIAKVCSAIGGKIIFDNNCYMKYRQHLNNTVGVNYTFFSKIKGEFKNIRPPKSRFTMDAQVKEILRIYDNEIPSQNKLWLNQVLNYRKNILNRIKLALTRKLKFATFRKSLETRLAIILGNI